MGCNASTYEHNCDFKENHMEKTHVEFKRYGDGYLHNALCADGYTYAVYLRNMLEPKEYTNKLYYQLNFHILSIQIFSLPIYTKQK